MIFTKNRLPAEHTRFENECMLYYDNSINKAMEERLAEVIDTSIEINAPLNTNVSYIIAPQ